MRIAYATVGRGPALVVPPGWISHLELLWQDPAYRAFFAPLTAARTVVHYDRPGGGLSDPWPGPPSLEADLEALAAVTGHLGLDRFDLLGISVGGPIATAFAAHHPAQTGKLIIYGGYADGGQLGTPEVRTAMLAMIRAHWGLGSGVLADVFLPDGSAESRARFAHVQLGAASAQTAAELLDYCYQIRIDDLLHQIKAPTLVLHRREDRAIPYQLGRDLAARIPGARLVSLSGRSHFPYAGDSAAVTRAVMDFLGEPASPAAPPARPDRPAPLTARQLQVAALLANGLTNRQIARQLGIEERSAEGHVERIRQRLGVTSRTQVAAWWARRASGH